MYANFTTWDLVFKLRLQIWAYIVKVNIATSGFSVNCVWLHEVIVVCAMFR